MIPHPRLSHLQHCRHLFRCQKFAHLLVGSPGSGKHGQCIRPHAFELYEQRGRQDGFAENVGWLPTGLRKDPPPRSEGPALYTRQQLWNIGHLLLGADWANVARRFLRRATPRRRVSMAICEVCGNDYDKSFELVAAGARHTFDSFECAIQAIAPICQHCKCRVIGHGVEVSGHFYCCAHCARIATSANVIDRVA